MVLDSHTRYRHITLFAVLEADGSLTHRCDRPVDGCQAIISRGSQSSIRSFCVLDMFLSTNRPPRLHLSTRTTLVSPTSHHIMSHRGMVSSLLGTLPDLIDRDIFPHVRRLRISRVAQDEATPPGVHPRARDTRSASMMYLSYFLPSHHNQMFIFILIM